MNTKRLILINLGVYIALKTLWLLLPAGSEDFAAVLRWIALPCDASVLLSRPWTLLSYAFVQVDFIHLLVNMLWLWWFGAILTTMRGDRAVWGAYLAGALAGGAAFVIQGSIAGMAAGVAGSQLAGASTAVAAIITATTLAQPRYGVRLFLVGKVPLWLITPIALLSFFAGPADALWAHVGGVAAGVAVWYRWRRQYQATTERVRLMMKATARRNRILEKARSSGFASLSDDERRELFDMTHQSRKASSTK